MDTIDEQLDNAVAKVNDLTGQLAAAQENLETVTAEKATLEAINAELTDNLTAAKDKLATQEVELHEAHAQIERLKADAKSAEQRAAEFYGTSAGRSEAVTPKGDPPSLPVSERFKALQSPSEQTLFIRSLSPTSKTCGFRKPPSCRG